MDINKKLALALVVIPVIMLALAVGLDIRNRQSMNDLLAPHCSPDGLCY